MIELHLEGIRKTVQYKDAYIFCYIESNMSRIDANQVRDVVQQSRFAPVHVEYQIHQNKPRIGVLTGAEEKKQYVKDLQNILSNGQACFPDDSMFVTNEPDKCKQLLVQQVLQFRRDEKVSNADDPAFSVVKETFSGKHGGRKDDLAMALQIALHHGAKKRMSDEYERLSFINGWRL